MKQNKRTSKENSVGSENSQIETGVAFYDVLQSPKNIKDSIQEVDFRLDLESKLLIHNKALPTFLGYDKKFSFLTWTNLFESQDLDIINHLLETFVSFNKKRKDAFEELFLNMIFRIKKKNNTYLKVLCQTSMPKTKNDNNDQLKIRLTNIDFITSSSNFAWTLIGQEKESECFRKLIAEKYIGCFTLREIEVVCQMNLGLSISEIANKLFISNHTVATHRKRLYKKTEVHNAKDLIAYCKVRGLIS